MNNKSNKFVITPKTERSITMTIRLETELNNRIEEIARKSGRSRNELINKALKFAFDNIEFDTVKNSFRELDIIVCEARTCGYSHLYTRVLIEKANEQIYKDYGKYQKSVIPKLDLIPYNKENKKSTS